MSEEEANKEKKPTNNRNRKINLSKERQEEAAKAIISSWLRDN